MLVTGLASTHSTFNPTLTSIIILYMLRKIFIY